MKVLRLILNELKKMFSRPAIIILLAFLLLFSAGAPMSLYYLEKKTDNFYDCTADIENEYDNAKTHYEQSLKNGDAVSIAQALGEFQRLQLVKDSSIKDYSDWRMERTYSLNAMLEKLTYYDFFIAKNEKRIEQMEKAFVTDSLDSKALEEFYTTGNVDKMESARKILASEINDFKTAIKNNDSKYFISEEIETYQATIKDLNKTLKDLNKQLKKYPKKAKEIQSQIDETNLTITLNTNLLSYSVLRRDLDVSYAYNDWKNTVINNTVQNVNTIYQKTLSEEEFKTQYKQDIMTQGYTYEKYLSDTEATKKQAQDQRTLNDYALKNNMPQIDSVSSTRSKTEGVYNFIIIISLFGVVITSSIVSSEFHKGTIRLLLTKSAARWKVLLSKLITVLLVTFVILALCSLIFILTNIGLYGIEDYKIPLLSLNSAGEVLETSMTSRLLGVMGKCSIEVLFFIAMAFFFTTVTKSTVLAVAAPMAIMVISPIANVFITAYASDVLKKILSFTFVPYISLSSMFKESFQSSGSPAMEYMAKDAAAKFSFDPNMGVAVFGVFAILFIAASFIVFCREDIK